MVWAVPHRRIAALLILFTAMVLSLVLLDLCYLGNLPALASALAHAGWLGFAPQSLSVHLLARILAQFFFDVAPGVLIASLCALVAWCASRRSRFFGNTAPLIVFLLLLAMGIFLPENGAAVTLFATLPFLLLFSAGVFGDLIQSKLQAPALSVIFA